MAYQMPLRDETGEVLQHIENKLHIRTVHNHVFVSAVALRSYMTLDKIHTLLVAIEALDTSRAQCEKIRNDYLAVFVILLEIGETVYLERFIRHDHLRDACLPFRDQQTLPQQYRKIFDQFSESQWKYCALELKPGALDFTFVDPCRIVPIIEQEPLSRGDSKTWKIRIHPDYNHVLRSDKVADKSPQAEWYVLKSCGDKYQNAFRNEAISYRYLSRQKDISETIVQYYGSWTQGETHNILLEYINGGTLEDLLHKDPHVVVDDMIHFCEQLSQLLKPLIRIHTQSDPKYHNRTIGGAHQDIKLSNILVQVSESGAIIGFKLADLGLSCPPQKLIHDANSLAREFPGTQMYSAPETYRDERSTFEQRSVRALNSKNDMWSLACVLSEVVVWCVLGVAGLEKYTTDRRLSTEHIVGIHQTAYSGCFHDGKIVLKAVRATFNQVLRRRAMMDSIIEYVLPIIESMFEPVGDRPDAQKVYRLFIAALERARDIPFPEIFRSSTETTTVPQSTHFQSPPGLGLNICTSPVTTLDEVRDVRGPAPDLFPRSEHPIKPVKTRFSEPATYSGHHQMPSAPRHVRSHTHQTPLQSRLGQQPSIKEEPNEMQQVTSPEYDVSAKSSTSSSRRPDLSGFRADGSLSNHTDHTQVVSHPTTRTMQGEGQIKASTQEPATIMQVLKWIKDKKRGVVAQYPVSEDILASLVNRDQIFIIDNSRSAEKHRRAMYEAFQALAYLVKGLDNDGMDLYFTNDGRSKCSRDRKDLSRLFGKVQFAGTTTIETALSRIFAKPKIKTWRPSTTKEPNLGKSIYILTTGVWEGENDSLCGLDDLVERLAKNIKSRSELAIQFIQFGDDSVGTWRLQTLDDLKDRGANDPEIETTKSRKLLLDIVDVEHHTGDVHKMLKGHLSDYWDQRQVSTSESDPTDDKSIENTTDTNGAAIIHVR